MRGIEGRRVRLIYQKLGERFGVKWGKRNYNPEQWDESDSINQCLSSATACLYGISEAAILAAGYSPAIGFVHVGKPRSFVFDIADLVKFETVVPVAFAVAADQVADPVRAVRLRCRDLFRQSKILDRLIPLIGEVLDAGGLEKPAEQGVVGPAFEEKTGSGDAGHRG